MAYSASVDEFLQAAGPGASVDRGVLGGLLTERPRPEAIVPLLSAAEAARVCAAVFYLGVYGSPREIPVLALCLQHDDAGVAEWAEYALHSISMQSGSTRGNQQLAAAIDCIQNAEYGRAVHLLSLLIADEPDFAEAHFQRGIALCFVNRAAEACQAYRRALRLNPYHFAAAAAAGHACIELGHWAGALHYYRWALRIHPRLSELPEAVAKLESMVSPWANQS